MVWSAILGAAIEAEEAGLIPSFLQKARGIFGDLRKEEWNDGEWHGVRSSNLDAFRYDEAQSHLDIEFHGGRQYRYYDISREKAAGLVNAGSPGGWWHANLKGALFTRL